MEDSRTQKGGKIVANTKIANRTGKRRKEKQIMNNKIRNEYQNQRLYEQNQKACEQNQTFYCYEKRIKYLDNLIANIESDKREFPKGNLRISKNGEKIQYYLITQKGDKNGCYIRKENFEMVKEIARRDYLHTVLKEAKRETKALKRFLKGMKGISVEEVYEELSIYRKELVEPILQSDRIFVNEWLNEQYIGNPFSPEEKVYETKRGEKVRSKSEVLLADMYYEMGIPYKYEYPIKMFSGKIRYPDFVLLKMPERKEIYHEHMGLLEEREYRQMNLLKLNEYAKSGIQIGDNLLITFETDYAPLVISDVKKMISHLLEK